MRSRLLILLLTCKIISCYGQKLIPVDSISVVAFDIKNLGVTVTGNFSQLSGEILLDAETSAPTSIKLAVRSATIDTGIKLRDKHLNSEDYFHSAVYPNLIFQSAKILKSANGYQADGSLTIKNITRQIMVPFSVRQKNNDFVFEGVFSVNRRDYNVGGSSLTLSDAVLVTFNIIAVEDLWR